MNWWEDGLTAILPFALGMCLLSPGVKQFLSLGICFCSREVSTSGGVGMDHEPFDLGSHEFPTLQTARFLWVAGGLLAP